MTINDEINALPRNQRVAFQDLLTNNLYDKTWCAMEGLDYLDPDIQRAKEILYIKLEERGLMQTLGEPLSLQSAFCRE